MSRRSRSRVLGAGLAGLLLATAMPLAGAAHTVPIDGATLASPAVVWVRTSIDTGVVVLEHQREITIHSSRYLLTMRQGSGVVVNHTGTVATAASVVAADLERAKIHAVNQLFAKVHKVRIAHPFTRTHLRDMRLHDKLMACYGASRRRECIITSQRQVIEVFPWASPAFTKGLSAQLVRATTGVALLQINGPTNMPTAALASAAGLPARATILGFSRPPRADGQPDRTAVPPDGLKKLTLKAGLSGGPVIDENGRMVGLAAAPGVDGAGKASFHPADEVAKALKAARIQPQRSVADSTFEQAVNYFSSQHDRHAAERFDRVLSYYPKHALAQHFRDDAGKLADSPQDRSGQMDEHGGMAGASGDGSSLTPWLVGGVIGLLALAGAAVLWRRRRPVDTPAGAASPAAAAPVTAGAAPPEKAPTPKADNGATGSKAARPAADPAARPSRPAVPPATPQAARSLAPAGTHSTGGSRGRQVAETSMQASPPSASGFAFCTQCGKPTQPGHRFCGYCGNRFG